jgi:PAS domain S-box-containing protein
MSSVSPGSELRRLQALVGDLDAVVWEADASSGRFTFMSEGAAEILGCPPAGFLGEAGAWADRIHPEDRDRALQAFMESVEQGGTHDTEYRFLRPDGTMVWIRDLGHAVTDVSGRPACVRGLMVDITQQKLAEEHRAEVEQRFRLLVEQTPVVTYIDPTGPGYSSEYFSPQVESMLGYTPDELTGEPARWPELLHPEDRERIVARSRASEATGEPFDEEYRLIARDGRVVWVHDQAVLIRDEEGAPKFWQGVWVDLSAQERAVELERALEAEREEAAELRALDEMKNTFLQAVSHDLRTPLAAILGLAVTLETQPELEPSDARDLASRIAANARKLDRMVTDLLDLDRISRGLIEPELRSTDVAELVRRVVADPEIAAGRSVELETSPAVAPVDPSKVERIVENLLSNAIRHTPASSRIWVRVGAEGGGALIAVEDEGPGVPPEHRDVIFQPFRQGAGAPEHSPGVGVGLALVASFAGLHGGRAWVQDREGGGASFRVWLPARATERSTGEPA